MQGIKIYTIDSRKMIKRGLPGWKANQEQAKTYFPLIKKDNKQYKVKIVNEKLIEELFTRILITKEKKILDANDFGILFSISYIKEDKYCMTMYYHPQNEHVKHYNISNYAKDESDYVLANNIIKWINEKAL